MIKNLLCSWLIVLAIAILFSVDNLPYYFPFQKNVVIDSSSININQSETLFTLQIFICIALVNLIIILLALFWKKAAKIILAIDKWILLASGFVILLMLVAGYVFRIAYVGLILSHPIWFMPISALIHGSIIRFYLNNINWGKSRVILISFCFMLVVLSLPAINYYYAFYTLPKIVKEGIPDTKKYLDFPILKPTYIPDGFTNDQFYLRNNDRFTLGYHKSLDNSSIQISQSSRTYDYNANQFWEAFLNPEIKIEGGTRREISINSHPVSITKVERIRDNSHSIVVAWVNDQTLISVGLKLSRAISESDEQQLVKIAESMQ